MIPKTQLKTNNMAIMTNYKISIEQKGHA